MEVSLNLPHECRGCMGWKMGSCVICERRHEMEVEPKHLKEQGWEQKTKDNSHGVQRWERGEETLYYDPKGKRITGYKKGR